MRRRTLLLSALGCAAGGALGCVAGGALAAEPRLTPAQSRVFRAWMQRIVGAQLSAGPSPRWLHRDCAGLVRFAVAEALRVHDTKWRQASGLAGAPLPPELEIADAQRDALRHRWRLADGSRAAYAGALELVQENARFVSRDCTLALAGDLLFFDQGDAQHLMVWMGSFIAYHTGEATPADNGLRAVTLPALQRWPDTRWQPLAGNPNFAGAYRLSFLTA